MKKRDQIENRYKWKLEDIIASDEAWEQLYVDTERRVSVCGDFLGKLDDESVLMECLTVMSEVGLAIERLYVYAQMRLDENSRDQKYQAMVDRAHSLVVRQSSATSYIVPQLSAFPSEKLEKLASNEAFSDYSLTFTEILRNRSHILSDKEEHILAEAGAVTSAFKTVFNMFDNADVAFAPIEKDGKKLPVSHGTYSVYITSPDADIRKSVFESIFGAYKAHINTISAVYAGNLKKDWFYSKLRGFKSSLEASMHSENVDSAVYVKLLDAIASGTPAMHRYMALRKKALGVDTLNMYDLHVSIVKSCKLGLNYEKAFDLVLKALEPMGEEYLNLLKTARDERWIDVFETPNKRSGAYSWGAYGTHPYVLLNHQKTIHDIFTIAHELGHAMHSYYSDKNQPYEKAGYEIFVAEIASTVNEVMMLKHLLKNADGDMKAYLLSYYLDMFRTTVFRQTMFSEFEFEAHKLVEQDKPVTPEILSDIYYSLNKKYYGRAVKHNDLIRYEWARIPHFYSSFYVYKYATGMISAISIVSKILSEGDSAVEKYKKFLSAGGSMPPLKILELAGVDLTSDEPYKLAIDEFSRTVSELNGLLNSKK